MHDVMPDDATTLAARHASRSLLAHGIRNATLLAVACLPTACSSVPGFDDPEITIEPRMYLVRHEGKARMQSVTGGQIINNAAMDTSRLGQFERDESYGGVMAVGDGFSGLEASFNKFEIDDSKEAVLTTDFGALQGGDVVNSDMEYDEYRLAYVAEIYQHAFEIGEEEEILWQLGAGGAMAHRAGDFNVREIGGEMASQEIDFRDDGTPYLQLRTRASWRNFSAQLDWAFNPDLHWGGDFEGQMHDIEVLLRYQLEAQNLSVVAGYRWSDLPFSGQDEGLRYDADFRVEGYVLGVKFGF